MVNAPNHRGLWLLFSCYYSLPTMHISSFCDFINIFFEHVMGDQFSAIHETSLWFFIFQFKDLVIKTLNEAYEAKPSISIFEEIQKQNKSLQQLEFLLQGKFVEFEFVDPRGKLVNKEHEPDSHHNTCQLSLRPYIPKEVLNFK